MLADKSQANLSDCGKVIKTPIEEDMEILEKLQAGETIEKSFEVPGTGYFARVRLSHRAWAYAAQFALHAKARNSCLVTLYAESPNITL